MTDNSHWASLSIPWTFRFDYPEGVAGVGSIWFMAPDELTPVLYRRFDKLEVSGEDDEPIYCYRDKYFRTATALEKYVCDELPSVIAIILTTVITKGL